MSEAPQNSRLHHVGYVVPSIAEAVTEYQAALSVDWDGEIVHDPLQIVRVTFLPSNGADAATVELVEPAGPRSPVLKFAQAGGGIHHVCYEVNDLKGQLESAQQAGCILVRVPLPAAAFGGRKIAWIKTASGQLIEFLQG
jgi:methylmalonyl-CoA/ethylmalonyl-CoA epimerase